MTTIRLARDGRGRTRLEALPLPFTPTGPAATDADRLAAPPPALAAAVVDVRAVVLRAADDTLTADAAPLVAFVVDGALTVEAQGSVAQLGPGDVLFRESALDDDHRITAADGTRLLLVEVAGSWTPSGSVPPAVDRAGPRPDRRPNLQEMYVADDVAFFRDFARLFDTVDTASAARQPATALKFITFSPGHAGTWHTDANVNLVCVVSGQLELEVGGKSAIECFRPGDVCLVQDQHGQGHILRAGVETRIVAVTLPDVHRWSADGAGSPGRSGTVPQELLEEPLTPEALTRAYQQVWSERGRTSGAGYEVTACPYSTEEIARLQQQGFRLGYLPRELATQHDRHRLADIFPGMSSYALHDDNIVTNDDDPYGWFEYEAAIDCPHGGTTERQLLDRVAGEGRVLLTLNQYIVASQDTRLLTGHHLDERGAWVRTRSRVDGRVATARFDGDVEAPGGPAYRNHVPGSLLVGYDLGADDHGPTHGGRTTPLDGRRTLARSEPPRTALHPLAAQLRRLDELDLDHEWRTATRRYVECGFAAELGMTADEYLRSLPALRPPPPGYRGRFDVPLVVETRIPWERQATLAGVRYVARTSDYAPVDERSRVPAAPYSAWFTAWGRRFVDPVSPADALAQLAPDEVGGSVVEMVAMTMAHPDVVASGRFLDAIGHVLPYLEHKEDITYAQVLRTPCMYHWRGASEIGANIHPRAFAHFRPLVRGTALATSADSAPTDGQAHGER